MLRRVIERGMKGAREANHQGIQTCHLCGKVQCGQRLGRVKCFYCSRIFCLQQLQRKFGIIATANDPHFKCPRCTGICCCMCNCQRPPPHVHCKVYKVRQNKLKTLEDGHGKDEAFASAVTNVTPIPPPIVDKTEYIPPPIVDKTEYIPPPIVDKTEYIPPPKQEVDPLPLSSVTSVPRMMEPPHVIVPVETPSVPRIPSLPVLDPYPSGVTREDPKTMEQARWEPFQLPWQEASSSWQFNSNDIPGSGARRKGLMRSSEQRLADAAEPHHSGQHAAAHQQRAVAAAGARRRAGQPLPREHVLYRVLAAVL